jgi:predicted RNA polymerase sigma factor
MLDTVEPFALHPLCNLRVLSIVRAYCLPEVIMFQVITSAGKVSAQ